MSEVTDFRTETQVKALSLLLGVDETLIAPLGRHGAEFVHDLRLAISDHLFDEQTHMFDRISKLAPLAPNALVAKIVPTVVTPLVAGRASGALGVDHQGRIQDLLGRMSPEYMADCAPYLDPRAMAEIAPKLDASQLLPAALILLAKHDYVTAAGFVEFATESLANQLVDGIDDYRAVVLTGALVYSDAALELVIQAIPDARYQALFNEAFVESDVAISALSIVSRLSPALRDHLLDLVAAGLDQPAIEMLRDLSIQLSLDTELRDIASKLLSRVSLTTSTA